MATASSSMPTKVSREAMAKKAFDADFIAWSSSLSVHGCLSSRPNTSLHREPLPTERLDKVLKSLRRLLLVLGLLPGGIGGSKPSFLSILKICLVVLTVGLLSSVFIVIQCYLLPNSSVSHDRTLLASEFFYSFSLSFTSWLIVASFWLRSKDVVQLLNEIRHLDPDVLFLRLWIGKAIVSILPFLLDAILFSVWNFSNLRLSLSVFWTYIYEASHLWLILIGSVPVIWYVFLAQLVYASLCTNNTTLAQAATCGGGGQIAILLRIHMKNLTLRRLYGMIEEVLSIPLLCSDIIITFTIINNVSYLLIRLGESTSEYIYISIVPIMLKVVTIMIRGRVADTVTAAAAAPKLLLAQAVQHKSAKLRHFPLWTQVPEQVVIYRLAEVPLAFSAGGIYLVSLSNISFLSACCTYIIVVLQFSDICKA